MPQKDVETAISSQSPVQNIEKTRTQKPKPGGGPIFMEDFDRGTMKDQPQARRGSPNWGRSPKTLNTRERGVKVLSIHDFETWFSFQENPNFRPGIGEAAVLFE